MQAITLPEQLDQPVRQRLQGRVDASDPLRQRGAGQRHALVGGDLFDPVKGQVIEVFAGRHPSQQANGGRAASITAGGIGAAVTVSEGRRAYFQLRADFLADLDQVGAALAALAGRRLMAVRDARQLRWQRLTADTLALQFGRGLGVEFFLDGGQVGIDRFLEQQALLASAGAGADRRCQSTPATSHCHCSALISQQASPAPPPDELTAVQVRSESGVEKQLLLFYLCGRLKMSASHTVR
jgi:hypothetical protein